jgi:hypothetical protein
MAGKWDRLAAGAGIGTVVLFVVGFLIVGDRPKIDDPVSELGAYYGDDRGQLVAGAILFGFGAGLFVWFVSALATMLYAHGQQRLAATAFAGGALAAGVLFLLMIVNAAALMVAQESGDEGALQALHLLDWAGEVVIAWPIAVLAIATALAFHRSDTLPEWLGIGSGVAGLVFLLNGTTWAQDGFWAPDGAFGVISFLVFLVWTVATSVELIRLVPKAALPRTATGAT